MPKLTVVMPAYNVARFIPEAVESILGQTFGDFVFLIIEGGSRDGTREIVGSYPDGRIVVQDLPGRELREYCRVVHPSPQSREFPGRDAVSCGDGCGRSLLVKAF